MSSLTILLKKEFLEIVRTKRLLILVIIFLFVAIASPIFAKLIPQLLSTIPGSTIKISIPSPTWHDAIDQFIKNINQLVGIVIVFMFAGAIAQEKNNKTLELILSKPVSRPNFILAKFFSSLLSVALIYFIAAFIFYYYSISIFGSFSLINFLWLILFLFVTLTFIISLTIFASTLLSGQIVAAFLAFFAEIILFTIPGYIDRLAKYSPGYLLSNYQNLMTKGDVTDFLPSLFVTIILIIILIIGSITIFQDQEVER